MYFRQLRYFVAVARSGSFSAAARILNVSQPALGQQVKALEDYLGVRLLERHSRGVELSEAGRTFIAHAEAVLRGMDEAYRALDPFRREPRTEVSIGVTPTPGRTLVPSLLAECEAISQLSIRVLPGLSDALFRSVESGKIDLALCYEVEATERLAVFPLYEEDLFLVGSPQLVHGAEGDLPFAELTRFTLVLDNRFQTSRQVVEQMARQTGVALKVSHEIEPINLKREMLLHHGRCSIVPYGLFLDEIREGQLAARRIVDPSASRQVCLVAHKDFPLETTNLLLSLFRSIVGDLVEVGELGWRALPLPQA